MLFHIKFINKTFSTDAIASSESVRIAPSLRSQKGAIWTKDKTTFDNWEVDIAFRISGRGRIGADGLVCRYKIKINCQLFFTKINYRHFGLQRKKVIITVLFSVHPINGMA